MSPAWNCYSFKYQLAVNKLFAKYTKLGNISNLHTSDRPHTVSTQIIINILKSLSGFICQEVDCLEMSAISTQVIVHIQCQLKSLSTFWNRYLASFEEVDWFLMPSRQSWRLYRGDNLMRYIDDWFKNVQSIMTITVISERWFDEILTDVCRRWVLRLRERGELELATRKLYFTDKVIVV